MLDKTDFSTEMGPQGEAQPSRELPHNIEAEQGLLGGLILNNDAFNEVNDFLKREHFYDPLHQRIFGAIKKRIQAGHKADRVTLKNVFENEEPLNGVVPVPQYLGRLVVNVSASANARDYGETVLELYRRREIILLGGKMSIDGFATEDDIESKDLIEGAQSSLDKLADHGGVGDNSCASLLESAQSVIEELRNPTQHNVITTGLADLDKTLGGGYPRGELTIVAARPSVGKSAFASSSSLKAARSGQEVLFFSLEMKKEALAARCLSDLSYTANDPISYADIMSNSVDDWRIDRLEKAQQAFVECPLTIDDNRGLTVSNIQSRIRQHINKLDKEGHKLDMVVIDHLGKIRAEQYVGNRHLEIGDITEKLAVIAITYDIAVVALCQLNRGVEGRDNKRPTLPDLNESGRIEQDANCVIGLHRPAYYLERMKCDTHEDENFRIEQLNNCKNQFEAVVLKQRNGACRPVELWCHMPTNSFGNKGR
jgi:replicative DNA helicase